MVSPPLISSPLSSRTMSPIALQAPRLDTRASAHGDAASSGAKRAPRTRIATICPRQTTRECSRVTSSQVRNEIAVLKKVSKGHRNIVTLHDYFEVRCSARSPSAPEADCAPPDGAQPLSLLRPLHGRRAVRPDMRQGQLLRGVRRPRPVLWPLYAHAFAGRDAAELIRTIMGAVKYIHDCGIVHRGECRRLASVWSSPHTLNRPEAGEPAVPDEGRGCGRDDRRLWSLAGHGRREVPSVD